MSRGKLRIARSKTHVGSLRAEITDWFEKRGDDARFARFTAQFETLAEFLGPGETWALHLLGNGGVGQTTLVRYLSSGRFAAERTKSPMPVARIDFDHLDPRYPEQRPAELLMALVSDLAGFTNSRAAYSAMRQVDDAAQVVHELLGPRSEREDPAGLSAAAAIAGKVSSGLDSLQQLGGTLSFDTGRLHIDKGAAAQLVTESFIKGWPDAFSAQRTEAIARAWNSTGPTRCSRTSAWPNYWP